MLSDECSVVFLSAHGHAQRRNKLLSSTSRNVSEILEVAVCWLSCCFTVTIQKNKHQLLYSVCYDPQSNARDIWWHFVLRLPNRVEAFLEEGVVAAVARQFRLPGGAFEVANLLENCPPSATPFTNCFEMSPALKSGLHCFSIKLGTENDPKSRARKPKSYSKLIGTRFRLYWSRFWNEWFIL